MSEPAPNPTGPRAPMTGWQVVSLIFGLILLLPGGCFLVFGVGMLTDSGGYASVGPPLLFIAFLIIAVAVLCLWIAFRRRNLPPPSAAS